MKKACKNCRFVGELEKQFREFYPEMKLQCNRQDFPGATVFMNATLIVPANYSCFEFKPKLAVK